MNLTKVLTPAVAVMALTVVAAPTRADDRHDAGSHVRGTAVARSDRGSSDRSVAIQRAAPRIESRRETFAPRVVEGSRAFERRSIAPRVIEREWVAPRSVAPYRPYFYRPYYRFEPRLRIGFGLYLGYPVQYPVYDPYVDSYPYGSPATSYPAPGYVAVSPETTAGGVCFEIQPADAGVYVDGAYVGTVNDFSPTARPLTLTPGRHRLEVRAGGYQPMLFDADVRPGQVLPYQGTMQPLRPY